jgi:DNA-binding XRE family transcriptional regulator
VRPADLDLAIRTIHALKTGQARKQREATGASQSNVAEVLKVTRQAVSQWESGIRQPSAAHALSYARLLRRLTAQSPPVSVV